MNKYLTVESIEEPDLRRFGEGLAQVCGSSWYLEVYVVQANKTNCTLRIVQVQPKLGHKPARRVVRTMVVGCGLPQYHKRLYVHLPAGSDIQQVLNKTQQRLEHLWNVPSNA